MTLVWTPGYDDGSTYTPGKLVLKKDSVAATDTNINEVSLLLYGNGTNGSTTITDNSPSPKTVTAFNSAAISTDQSRFGGSSLFFPGGSVTGTSHRLESASNANFQFGSGDFTIELWLNATAQDLGAICAHTLGGTSIGDSGTPAGWVLFVYDGADPFTAQRKLTFMLNGASFVLTSTVDGFSDNTWTYIAITKQGTGSNNIKMYSGASGATTLIAQGTYATAITNATTSLMVGSLVSGVNWNTNYPLTGYIDDFRITKGVARDVSTVPTESFPNY